MAKNGSESLSDDKLIATTTSQNLLKTVDHMLEWYVFRHLKDVVDFLSEWIQNDTKDEEVETRYKLVRINQKENTLQPFMHKVWLYSN